jgi:hypothetical protein
MLETADSVVAGKCPGVNCASALGAEIINYTKRELRSKSVI